MPRVTWLGVACVVLVSGAFRPAHAFVQVPVGGTPGSTDVVARVTLERGNVEPHANAQSWNHAQCRIDARQCEFHRANAGLALQPRVFANVVHDARAALGFYLQGTVPIGINLNRFELPRLDPLTLGVTLGVYLTSWLDAEAHVTYAPFGWQLFDDRYQNGAITQTTLLGAHASRWLLPHPWGVKAGVYFEGDNQQRFDDRYDAAFVVGYRPGAQDGQGRERIRALKLGLVASAYVELTPSLAVELGTVQKRFGYDAVATQSYVAGLAKAARVRDVLVTIDVQLAHLGVRRRQLTRAGPPMSRRPSPPPRRGPVSPRRCGRDASASCGRRLRRSG